MMSTLYLWIHGELIYMKRGGGTRFNDDTNISTEVTTAVGCTLWHISAIIHD